MRFRILAVVAATAALIFASFVLPGRAQAAGDSEPGLAPLAPISLTNFQAAAVVIGQVNFSAGLPNQGMANPTASTTTGGFGSVGVGPTGAIYFSDYSNQRVLGFLTVPTSNDANADFVLGQPNFTSTGGGTAANQFGGPQSPYTVKGFLGTKLVVADFYNSRVLIWRKAPTSNQVKANVVIGQAKFGTRNSACTAFGLNAPETLSIGGGHLVVADSSNARVLIYNRVPGISGQRASLVLGQNNFKTCVTLNNGTGASGSPSAANFSYPAGVWTDGTRLVVTDEDENRVLIWKKFPTKNFQPADIVLGQPSFTSDVADNDGSNSSGPPTASNLKMPYDGVFSNGTQLFIDDQMNNRILVWNTFPTANFAPADVVLGQPNFACGVANNDGTGCVTGGPSANNLSHPTGITQVGSQLIVVDGNSRYLIY